ncbi:Mbov_0398 family ICE element protein [[Mycoplasma] anseris]|uniref:Uncharacterized protein n=1 Tax=[Mycoplasma] anseris TaxID=92400 RepID=A0A2Z4NCX5_9BACT|nr:hypothetical protein [[Mycoplasma] anseris]AWX69421.1 hypothetical protein DP065_01470 [[Mycoplasma] anseris]
MNPNIINNLVDFIKNSPKKSKEEVLKVISGKENLGGRPKINLNGEVRGFFRFTELNDILTFRKWKENLDQRGISIQKEVNDLIRKGISESEAIGSIRSFKNEIRYALTKANFAALSPFYTKLEKHLLKQDLMIDVINYKLNLIINTLFGVIDINSDKAFELISANDIETEPNIFNLIKKDMYTKIEKRFEVLEEKQKEINKTNNEFLEDVFFNEDQKIYG